MATSRRIVACLLILLVGTLVGVTSSHAQVTCYGPSDRLPQQDVTDFTNNPGQLLQRFPDGGPDLISHVRDLAATSGATLQPLLDLVANANPHQVDAIGTGLAQAALVCVRYDQQFATEIQQAVAALGNQALELAFAAVLGDKPIGAVGGGGGGGGGGGPTNSLFGSTGLAGGTSGGFPSFGTINHPTNFFTLSGPTGSSPTFPTSTPSTSVSPTR